MRTIEISSVWVPSAVITLGVNYTFLYLFPPPRMSLTIYLQSIILIRKMNEPLSKEGVV